MNLRTFIAATFLKERAVPSAVLVWLAMLAFVGFGNAQTSYTNIVIPTNSVWRWLPGTNEASIPTNAWRFLTFDDSAWPVASAPFHYGTNSVGGDDTLTNGTILSGMQSNYTCVFLRQKFVITNAGGATSLRMKLYFDDGFVVWLNGVKIRSTGVATTEPAYTNAATASREFFGGFVDPDVGAHTNLVEGTNVLTVQAFNAAATNDDFRIDPELYISFGIPPVLQNVSPAPGAEVADLSQITVTFSQTVTNVDNTDLLMNGQPATFVSGSGATYTFFFNRPSVGLVQVAWDPQHGIRNLIGLSFDASASQWSYAVPLATTSVAPAPSSTLASVTEVQATFNDAVVGVDAADLLINGAPATSVFGSGAGPYIFSFPAPAAGAVQFSWAPGHGIRSAASQTTYFPGGSWSITLNPAAFSGDVIINEFIAGNSASNHLADVDEDLDVQDWIELYNRGTNAVRMLGWSLTDDKNLPGQWTFPDVTLQPGKYLLVYASAKNRAVVGGTNSIGRTNQLHTNFKLNAFGEYLGLFNADSPRQVIFELNPQFPEQRNEYSYGLVTSNEWRYFAVPTPLAPNGTSVVTQVVPIPHVNVSRGVFDQPFTLVVSCDMADATLIYTTNGSAPALNNGAVYNGPLTIGGTTVFRVAGFRANTLPSRVSTHSYLFYDNVIRQPNNPPGYPAAWITTGGTSYPADYEMDPEVVTNATYAARVKPALAALPALSLVMKIEDMFSQTNGIYSNPNPADAVRYLWERACSAEFIPTNDDSGFQVDCGIRIQGNASRDPTKTSKHPMRLLFKGDYGPGQLDYQIFPDSPIKLWDTVVLRADFNNSWVHWDPSQRNRGTRFRDSWGKDTFRAMGSVAGHSRYCNVFINGLYWGVYEFSERIDKTFAANYLGGNPDDYDVMASKPTEAIDGNRLSYDVMIANVRGKDMRLLPNYTAAAGYANLTNYVDYMILNFYAANQDWGFDGNWNAICKRVPGALYQWCVWDAERYIEQPTDNRVSNVDVASGLHTNLINSAEYKVFFGDRAHKHLFNDGALTTNQSIARLMNRAMQLDSAIVAESARWGDNRRDVMTTLGGGTAPFFLYGRDTNWVPELNRLITNYFPLRTANFLAQLRAAGLYPNITAPTFSQHGGRIAAGFALSITGATTTVYYTTNGADPRVYGTGATSPSAIPYSSPIPLSSSVTVRARALSGTSWSALVEATFVVDSLASPLRITEIMYNPVGGDAYEYIELRNVGSFPMDLSTYSFTGIAFTFPIGFNINPGQTIVLGSLLNTNAFKTRYPGVNVAGWFEGALSNGGEKLALLDKSLRTVVSVDYDDENGWPTAADGGGYSLEFVNINGDPDDPANWRASLVQNGTPGIPGSAVTPPQVVINEVMAENVTFLNTNGVFPDWIELYNSGGSAANISGWSVTDDGSPRKFVFPPGSSIPAGGYLVVWCDSVTNAAGLHTGFALSRGGDGVFLYDPSTNRVDAISFGPQAPDYTIGLVGADWVLTTPTPGAANSAASLAASSSISINEWLANAVPGGNDWVELFNDSSTAPASVQNMYLGTSNGLFQIRSLSFIPPRGYLQLIADESPGADHLDFKLPATPNAIVLYSASGAELQRVTYGAQAEGVSQGRLPDGSAAIVTFPGSASPGASNFVLNYSGPVLNELLARNSTTYSPWGDTADFIELYNPGASSFSLSGFGLSDDSGKVKFRFGPAVTVAANGYLAVWCEGSRAALSNAAPFNASFSLSGNSGGVYLFNTNGQVVSSVEYGPQAQNLSIGLSGGQWLLLSNATPAAVNSPAAALGSISNLVVNEWMADGDGDDWFELYNRDPLPLSLTGLILTDDPSVLGTAQPAIAPLSFVAGNGWVQFLADGERSAGRDHVGFDLEKSGEMIRVYAPNLAIIDSISFGSQSNSVSQGRLPDGASNIVSFVTTPTPGAANYLPHPAMIVSEVLAHTDLPFEDAIELQNISGSPVDIGNWWISNSEQSLKKYRVPAGTIVAPGGFAVVYENQFNPDGTGNDPSFTLNSARGDSVYVAQADAAGVLSGYRAQVSFGASENAVSFGRYASSNVVDFVAMAQRTFGADNPSTVAQFRGGTGRTNTYPKVGPLIINEINYHPVNPLTLLEDPNEEFVELLNVTGSPLALFDAANPSNTWRLRGGISFNFSTNTTVSAGGYLLVVGFDPVANPAALAGFRSRFGNNGVVVGPFSGRLANDADTIELYKPDAPQVAPHPDAGYVPYILADRVAYRDAFPWPVAADGGNASLQRTSPALYGNEPANWKAEYATAGRTNSNAGNQAPVISGQPQSKTVIAGVLASFSVTASGVPAPAYQWLHAGTNLPGATSATLTIASPQAADAGVYRVLVSNVAGSIASQDAVLTVIVPPSISVPPQDISAVAGTSAQLGVTASGTAPLYYQWRKTGSDIPGANNPQLVFTVIDTSHAGSYTVVITNAAGSITSSVATVTIVVPPTITSDLTDQSVLVNSPATFTVSATGTAPLSYEWRKNGSLINGATGPSYTIQSAQTSDEGIYTVRVSNAGGFATSAAASLVVSVAPVLGAAHPLSDGSFMFTLSGASNSSYLVEFSGNLSSWSNLTTVTLTNTESTVQDKSATNAAVRFYRARKSP